MVLIGKNRSTGEKLVTVPHCQPQIPQGLAWDRTVASAVRGRRQTVWSLARTFTRVSSCTCVTCEVETSSWDKQSLNTLTVGKLYRLTTVTARTVFWVSPVCANVGIPWGEAGTLLTYHSVMWAHLWRSLVGNEHFEHRKNRQSVAREEHIWELEVISSCEYWAQHSCTLYSGYTYRPTCHIIQLVHIPANMSHYTAGTHTGQHVTLYSWYTYRPTCNTTQLVHIPANLSHYTAGTHTGQLVTLYISYTSRPTCHIIRLMHIPANMSHYTSDTHTGQHITLYVWYTYRPTCNIVRLVHVPANM
jgi:hypothetical protein